MSKGRFALALASLLIVSSLAFGQARYGGEDDGGYEGNRAERHQKRCVDRYAYKVAKLAYLEAKLGLNDQQRPAWNKWRQAKIDAAEQRRTRCLQHTPGEVAAATAVERATRLEKRLAARLQEVQATRPLLQSLYDSLSAEQKATFDQAVSYHRHHGRWHQGEHGDHRHMWREQ